MKFYEVLWSVVHFRCVAYPWIQSSSATETRSRSFNWIKLWLGRSSIRHAIFPSLDKLRSALLVWWLWLSGVRSRHLLYTSEFAHGRNLGSKKGVVFLEEFCRSVSWQELMLKVKGLDGIGRAGGSLRVEVACMVFAWCFSFLNASCFQPQAASFHWLSQGSSHLEWRLPRSWRAWPSVKMAKSFSVTWSKPSGREHPFCTTTLLALRLGLSGMFWVLRGFDDKNVPWSCTISSCFCNRCVAW